VNQHIGTGKRMDQSAADLVQQNIGWMLAVATRILNDRSLAEDAVQSAFEKVFEKQSSFEGRSDIRTWIHRITVNEALGILRRVKRRSEDQIDEFLPQFDTAGCRITPEVRTPTLPDDVLETAQIRDIVAANIAKLPETYRIVIVLRDIEGLSTAEVVTLLEISEANAKIRLHRARSALKALLDPLFKEGAL